MIDAETNLKQPKQNDKDKDGLHKRRGIWHFKLKVGRRWKECSTHTTSYQAARKERHRVMQAQREGRVPTDVTNWPLEKAAKDWLAGRVRLSYDNIVELARELGVHRRLLYKWQDQLEPVEQAGEPVPSSPEMRKQVRQVKRECGPRIFMAE